MYVIIIATNHHHYRRYDSVDCHACWWIFLPKSSVKLKKK